MQSIRSQRRGFSLVELVVVIVIIGILAAMAIPRLSRGSSGAADAALSGNLAVIRNAIEMYAAEHRNTYPGPTAEKFEQQLTSYTDLSGNVSATRDTTHLYGPYLQSIPPMPIGDPSKPTEVLIDATNSPPTVVTTGGEGWLYNPSTGEFIANTSDTDQAGRAFSEY
jgi:prepilin-type N-terminal cleavage/methylation domain-containing protein